MIAPFADFEGEVRLARWYAADGEYVKIDQPICEVENDRASADIAAWASGFLRHNARPGDVVRTNPPFAVIESP